MPHPRGFVKGETARANVRLDPDTLAFYKAGQPARIIVANQRFGGAHQIGREFEHRVVVELGGEPLVRQLGAVALHARKSDLQRIAVRPHRLDLYRLPRLLASTEF